MKKEKISSVIIIIFIIVGIFYWINFNNRIDNLEYCIDDCVIDHDMCLTFSYTYDSKGNTYISYLDSEECVLDLEDCIYYCED